VVEAKMPDEKIEIIEFGPSLLIPAIEQIALYEKIIKEFKREIPQGVIATDIIVGYPTENNEDHKKNSVRNLSNNAIRIIQRRLDTDSDLRSSGCLR
jgi:hypothetical protein